MRWQRYGFIFLTFYLVFFGGGGYFQIPTVRYFHHIFMTVLIAGWLIWRLQKGRGIPPSPINYPLYGLVLIWFITTAISLDPRMALENLWFTLVAVMMFWFIVNAFQRAQQRLLIETLFLVTVIIVFLAGIQIFSVIFGWGIARPSGDGWINYFGQGISMPWQRDMRIWLPLTVSTWVSGVVAPLVTITLTWALSTPRQSDKRLFWFLAILLAIVLVLTFSRGGLVSVAAAIACFVFLRMLQNQRFQKIFTGRNIAILGALAILVAGLALVVITLGNERGHQSGDQLRFDLWRSGVEMFQDSPITGVGMGLYGRALRSYRSIDVAVDDRLGTAHNLYLNSAAETGIFTIIVGLWAALLIVRVWWQQRQAAETDSLRRIRLDGMFAALVGIALHNMFDTLTITASLALMSLIIVYCTVEPASSRLDEPPKGNPWTAIIFLILILAYGIWFVAVVDPAQRHYENSLRSIGEPLEEAQQAESIDSSLNLYDMQITYILGQRAFNNLTDENLASAIMYYNSILELEPTWDTGWLNLGALYELTGDLDAALQAYDNARNIHPRNPGKLHWARLAETLQADEPDKIIEAYQSAIAASSILPLSSFWYETDLRRQALEAYTSQITLDSQYRIWAVHEPERLEELVPENPQTAAEWWVVGEYALIIENDAQKAEESFSQALALAPNNGDYYASRARATIGSNPETALNDLNIARFLGTRQEYPNAIEIALHSAPDEIMNLRAKAVPPPLQSQNFEGVLFGGRSGNFMLFPTVRSLGPGTAAMQPWYDLAGTYEAQGDIENTIRVYEAILNYAPDESRARLALEQLQ